MDYQIESVASGLFHCLVLLKSGEVYVWGSNRHGQLGIGAIKKIESPQLIKTIPDKVIAIAAGTNHSFALTKSRKVYSWGCNEYGQLGDGTTQQSNHPRVISDLPSKVVSVSAGGNYTLSLLEDGKVYSWGCNEYGQLGYESTKDSLSPQLVEALPCKAISIAAGFQHSLALLETGKVYSWGENSYGQLGDGKTQSVHHPHQIKSVHRPCQVKGIPGKVVAIAAGVYHSLALLESGVVYGWGGNRNGQLGDGTIKDTNHPQLIFALPSKVKGIAAGYYQSLALLENGETCGWGNNAYGQLGIVESQNLLMPSIIPEFQNVLIPSINTNVDKRILQSLFGKGGKVVGLTELEKKFRDLIGQNINL